MSWTDDNNRYLAASLKWLRSRLQQLASPPTPPSAPPPSPAPVAAPQPRPTSKGWFGPKQTESAPATAAAPAPAPQLLLSAGAVASDVSSAAQEREAAAHSDPVPALILLAQRFGLTTFERDILLLSAATEFDPGMASLYAAAQGQGGAGYATFALALQVFDDTADRTWDALSPQRPLRHARLIEVNPTAATALTASPLRADERVVNYLKGLNVLDERIASLAKAAPSTPTPLASSQHETAGDILRRLRASANQASLPLVQLTGADTRSKLAIAADVCANIGRQVYRLPLEALPASRVEIENLARLWQRESLLLPVALYIDAEQLDSASAELVASFRALVSYELGLVFVGLRETPSRPIAASIDVEVETPTGAEQYTAWRAALSSIMPAEEVDANARVLAGQFDLDLAEIQDAASRVSSSPPDVTPAIAVWRASRSIAQPRLDLLAQRLDPKATWDDLVLSAESLKLLHQIAGQVRDRYRVYEEWGYARRMTRGLGINALFAGESGTGKTMAAEVIANELDLLLYRIDLSAVVSKYIGETEKNLRTLFDAAEQGGAILFFDEADALFGKRSEVKDSHDRYANIEINYLLQRMEAFSGLAILATNMKSALDPAFMRRLRFIVNFPFPSPTERQQMWRKALPPDVPQEELDYERLARFNVSGGNIHSIALNAAFMAAQRGSPVTESLLLAATRTELRKLDKPLNEAEFR